MATVLEKALKRQVSVDGVDYTVAVDPEGLRLTQKGKRKPEVELRWRELLSGEAAMAVALNASLAARPAVARPAAAAADGTTDVPRPPERSEGSPPPPAAKKRGRRQDR